MIIQSANFIKSAVTPDQYPPPEFPEFAFSGRSNVGKSSLINTLVNRKHLVKTSSTPGRTQHLNFFLINEEVYFVDLPGYGYAKVPIAIKKTWGPMIETYLSTRGTLKGVLLIMDIRRIPGTEEMNFTEWLAQFNIPSILVLTKADKLSRTNQIRQQQAIAKALSVDKTALTLFSAKSHIGKEELWERIYTTIKR